MESSPLNKLAGELRNDIYELVFTRSEPIYLNFTLQNLRSPVVISTMDGHEHFLALTATCRQARTESLLLALSANAYRLLVDDYPFMTSLNPAKNSLSAASLGCFLRKFDHIMPGASSCFKNITVDLGIWHRTFCPYMALFSIVKAYMRLSAEYDLSTTIVTRLRSRRYTVDCELRADDTRSSAEERMMANWEKATQQFGLIRSSPDPRYEMLIETIFPEELEC